MVKIAFMGVGGIAERMAPTLTGMIFEGDQSICRYAVAARELDRACRFAQKHGFEKAYGSYDEMLEDGEVDLVYIATPHSHHYEHIKKCLAHGKHVLCEKAFTVNAAQAREVLALAEEKRLLLTEAMWTRYMPSMKIIKEIMDSGEIGKPMTICGNLSANLQHVARMTDPALAGGVLLDDLWCGVGAAGAVAVERGKRVAPVHLYRSVHPGFLHGRPAVPGHVRPVPAGGGTERGSGLDHLRERGRAWGSW